MRRGEGRRWIDTVWMDGYRGSIGYGVRAALAGFGLDIGMVVVCILSMR